MLLSQKVCLNIQLSGLQLTATDDRSSIERLNQVTLANVKDERLQLLYIATQTASISLKIHAAMGEVMKVYKRVLGTVSALSSLPMASSTTRASSAISICREIVQCFGLPTVNHATVFEIVKSTVWDDASHNILIAFAETSAFVGMLATVATAGMPIFLATGAFNFPLVIPATSRLMLMLASDLILILVRAFRVSTTTCVGQPSEKDVARAARDYRPVSGQVHREIFKLVPRRNVVKSFRYNKVRLGFEAIVERFKEATNTSNSDPSSRGGRDSFASDRTKVDEEVEKMTKLCLESRAELNDKFEQIQETIAARSLLEGLDSSEKSDEESSS